MQLTFPPIVVTGFILCNLCTTTYSHSTPLSLQARGKWGFNVPKPKVENPFHVKGPGEPVKFKTPEAPKTAPEPVRGSSGGIGKAVAVGAVDGAAAGSIKTFATAEGWTVKYEPRTGQTVYEAAARCGARLARRQICKTFADKVLPKIYEGKINKATDAMNTAWRELDKASMAMDVAQFKLNNARIKERFRESRFSVPREPELPGGLGNAYQAEGVYVMEIGILPKTQNIVDQLATQYTWMNKLGMKTNEGVLARTQSSSKAYQKAGLPEPVIEPVSATIEANLKKLEDVQVFNYKEFKTVQEAFTTKTNSYVEAGGKVERLAEKATSMPPGSLQNKITGLQAEGSGGNAAGPKVVNFDNPATGRPVGATVEITGNSVTIKPKDFTTGEKVILAATGTGIAGTVGTVVGLTAGGAGAAGNTTLNSTVPVGSATASASSEPAPAATEQPRLR